MKTFVRFLGAGLGIAGLLLAIAVVFFDVKALVVKSGSMEPTIPTGALAFAIPAEQINVGDIVSTNINGVQITHRVVEITGMSMTLKGDANQSPDPYEYSSVDVHRVVFTIPLLGYLIVLLPWIFASVVIGTLLWLIFTAHNHPGRHRLAHAVAFSAVLAFAWSADAKPTAAYFSDDAAMASATVGSHAVVLNENPSCENKGGILGGGLAGYVILAWEHIDQRYVYDWKLVVPSTGSTIKSGTITPTVAGGDDVEIEVRVSLLTLVEWGLTTNWYVEITPRIKNTNWSSSTSTQTKIHNWELAIVGLSVRCDWR